MKDFNPFKAGMVLANLCSWAGLLVGKSSEYILVSALAVFLFWGLDERLPRK